MSEPEMTTGGRPECDGPLHEARLAYAPLSEVLGAQVPKEEVLEGGIDRWTTR